MNLLTRKIPTILGLLLLVVGVVGYILYSQSTATKTNPEVVPTKVRITNISDNKFTVSWTTGTETMGSVEYGAVGEKLTTVGKDERDGATQGKYRTHHVTMDKLQPSTQYAFRILSGEKPTRFDNNGTPYTTSTGPVIGATPASQNFYGNVQLPSKQSANGSIVYITMPNGATASTIVRESGNYAFTLSTIRTADLRNYVTYDPSATIASLTVESGDQQTISAVSLANSAPVPTITLGQNADFLNAATTPAVAEVVPTENPEVSPEQTPEPVGIFNVEPIAIEPAIDVISTSTVAILNPKVEGETLTTLRPEFRGTGPVDMTLSIALTGQKAISDTTQVARDGTWSWAPVIDLKVGKQKIAITYLPTGGTTQKIERNFTISNTPATLDPAFISSPSASTTTVVPTTTPREVMPATNSGVPVTGVIENTLIASGLGIIIMLAGAALLVF